MLLRSLPEFADLSRSRVQTLIESGGVLLNDREVLRGQKNCRPGDRLKINVEQLRWLVKPLLGDDFTPVEMELNFHHVDEQLIVVEKPAGLSTHPSSTESGPTLAAGVAWHFGQLSDKGGPERPGIVHRLDKETSGLLVIARDNLTHMALQRQFAERIVEKRYLALCTDIPKDPVGRIEAPIERHPHDRKLMWARGGGRASLTEYQLNEMWGPFALLELEIHTGRTHQIRVHLQLIGVGILNDYKYAPARNTALRNFLRRGIARDIHGGYAQWLADADQRREILHDVEHYKGIFLHAHSLSFIHPATEQRLQFRSMPPPIWGRVRAQATGSID
jgi:23S rRNA pseudouridine1911/1915/1917 synthase